MQYPTAPTTPGPSATAPAEFTDQIQRCVELLQRNPEDEATVERLREIADAWVRHDGLAAPTLQEKTERVGLALWLAHLAPGGRIQHVGWREGSIAAALASRDACVCSFLDHTGRSIAASLRWGNATTTFRIHDELDARPVHDVDLLVVETSGPRTVVALERTRDSLRDGGWLAILGHPLVVDSPEFVELGLFCVDVSGHVRPSNFEPHETRVHLYRRVAASTTARIAGAPAEPPATVATPLARLMRSRADQSSGELALQAQAARIGALPVPPQTLIDWVGGGTPASFDQIGLIDAMQLMIYCRLAPTDRVLEPGCGCGHNARYLAPYLDASAGGYDGFDIHEGAIRWAQEQIGARYANTRFAFADIVNTHYNPQGRTRASEYTFPYESGSFDVVFMPSVFTHMTDPEFRRYAGEIARVLRPGGRLLSWHFLLNASTRERIIKGRAAIEFSAFDVVSWVQFQDNPCAAIAFDEAYVLETYESLGLRGQAVIRGRWSGDEPDGYPDYQDRILAVKR